MKIIMGVVTLLLCFGTVFAKDYTILDKRGDYRGYVRDDSSSVTRYDRDNRQRDWVDKDSGAVFDRSNNPRGFILEDRDDD